MALFDNEGNEITPIVGTEGNDNFILVDSDETLDLLAGNDILVVIGDNNTISGGSGNDDLTDDGTGTGNIFDGGSGNDTLFGGTSGTLNGGTGRDVIFASPNGQGGNTISGGTGRDVFYIGQAEIPSPSPANTITDFNPDLDILRISLLPGLTASNQLTFTPVDGNTTISFGGDNIAIVNDTITAGNVEVITDSQFTPPPLPNEFTPVFSSDTYDFENTGTVTATDGDEDEPKYTIAEGENASLFAINEITGLITIVADVTLFPVGQTKTITVQVSDEPSTGADAAKTDTATVDITRTEFVLEFSLDIDDNGAASEASDALLINQYLTTKTFGVTLTDEDIAGLFDPAGTRTTAAAISAYLDPFYDDLTTGGLDVDGNGAASEASDALLINQYLTTKTFGVTLLDEDIAGLFDPAGTRTTAAEITTFLDPFMPPSTSV
jgi:hypothetical protein